MLGSIDMLALRKIVYCLAAIDYYKSYHAIMEHFQKIGLKRKCHREKEKKLWTVTTIRDMLKNEVYLGRTVWNKTRRESVGSKSQIKNDRSEWIIIEGTHEPLVTKEIGVKNGVNHLK